MPSPSSSAASSISITTNSAPTPPSANGITNSNGKRPHTALTTPTAAAMSNNTPAPNGSEKDAQVQIHKPSGYKWTREVDEPGYTYTSKKAQDEVARLWETLVHRDAMVKGRYGDPVEVAEKERSMMEG